MPVTLARVVSGQLVGVAGGRSAANGGYVFRVPVGPGTHFFQVVTATAKSRVYGLVVPRIIDGGPFSFLPPWRRPVFGNCTEVRAAGRAPIRRGEPGFGDHLDRDRDGVRLRVSADPPALRTTTAAPVVHTSCGLTKHSPRCRRPT